MPARKSSRVTRSTSPATPKPAPNGDSAPAPVVVLDRTRDPR